MKISTVKLYTLLLNALWWGVGELEVLCGFQAALTGRWDPGGFCWAADGLTQRWVLSLCHPHPQTVSSAP